MLGRALVAEQLALRRLQHALQHLAALRGFRIGDPHAGNRETRSASQSRIALANAQGRLRDEPHAAPLEIIAQLEHFGDGPQGRAIAFPRHDALVLVLHLRLAVFELPQQHQDRLQNVERLEAGDRRSACLRSARSIHRGGSR